MPIQPLYRATQLLGLCLAAATAVPLAPRPGLRLSAGLSAGLSLLPLARGQFFGTEELLVNSMGEKPQPQQQPAAPRSSRRRPWEKALPAMDTYDAYPQRSADMTAVLEWGHSAQIQNLDAAVAEFGTQIVEGESVLFEVEASLVRADPQTACPPEGMPFHGDGVERDDDDDEDLWELDNAGIVHGQILVVHRGTCDFVTKAAVAAAAGAAAVVVINTDMRRPDHAFSMAPSENDDASATLALSIDIPVVMISYNSAMHLLELMPPRMKLLPGGGRPFIEALSDVSPTVYLIHHLLTDQECDRLVQLAAPKLHAPSTAPTAVGYDDAGVGGAGEARRRAAAARRASRSATLALGALKGPTLAAVDARISQVIGYPPEYFADIEVHRVEPGGKSDMHYDWEPSLYQEQIMTLLLCLGHVNEGDGGETLFPYANPPVKVRPVKGLAIVYHNIGEDGYPDRFAFRGDAELQNGTKWYAAQWILDTPVPPSRRYLIPAMLWPLGGRLPDALRALQRHAAARYGADEAYVAMNWAFTIFAFLMVSLVVGGCYLWAKQVGALKVQQSAMATAASLKGTAGSGDLAASGSGGDKQPGAGSGGANASASASKSKSKRERKGKPKQS